MPPELVWVAALVVTVAVFLASGDSNGSWRYGSLAGQDLSGRVHRRDPPMPIALVLDLVAAGLDAGVSPSAAVRAVSDVLAAVDDPSAELLVECATMPSAVGSGRGTNTGLAGPVGALQRALALAQTTGIAPASLVRSAAEQERCRRAAAQAVAARRLGVFAVVPLAVCLLPAFLVLTVIPVVLDLLQGM